ncbi:Aste57867_13742 [Aphanomyces stellatus]|uniref:Aste57867_13742 protein n=1 Tax=Aphanomyces stellatus TaxID=120398 RepID=A0A485KYX5_9STRA|nr:hypothetical protein As57867_013692 [Aphanomyces stellatus]VFT90575.1 Aste57867_13742 [Aphanomyces stellatus]
MRRNVPAAAVSTARAPTANETPKEALSPWLFVFPILVPTAGLLTMASTIGYSCMNQFTCSKKYPTLSTAATYHPQFYFFAVGMNITSYAIFLAVSLFSIYLQRTCTKPWVRKTAYVYYGFGLLTCGGLSVLATFDMKRWLWPHIYATVFFFFSSWIMMFIAQVTRWTLQYYQPDDVRQHTSAVRWGAFFLGLGIFLSLCFGFCYLSVHGYIDNVFGITYLMEAMCELFSIVCQLLFMGTLSSEVGGLRGLGHYVTLLDATVLSTLLAAVVAVEYL